MISDYLYSRPCLPTVPVSKSISFSSPSLTRCLCVRQLSGLLPVKLHERTGGCTFLLKLCTRGIPSPVSLSCPFCFCTFLNCNIQLCKPWASLPSSAFFSLLSCNRGEDSFLLKCSELCIILHSWHTLSVHTLLSLWLHGNLHLHCQLAFFG